MRGWVGRRGRRCCCQHVANAHRSLVEIAAQQVNVARGRGEVLVPSHSLHHVHRHSGAKPKCDRVVAKAVHGEALDRGSAAWSAYGLDNQPLCEQDLTMSSAAVRNVIALASELSEDERRVVVDAIAPKESIATLAEEWEAEIARRAERVRSGQSRGKPADEVFDRLESKLKSR
jgi:hypothetical protein